MGLFTDCENELDRNALYTLTFLVGASGIYTKTPDKTVHQVQSSHHQLHNNLMNISISDFFDGYIKNVHDAVMKNNSS